MTESLLQLNNALASASSLVTLEGEIVKSSVLSPGIYMRKINQPPFL